MKQALVGASYLAHELFKSFVRNADEGKLNGDNGEVERGRTLRTYTQLKRHNVREHLERVGTHGFRNGVKE